MHIREGKRFIAACRLPVGLFHLPPTPGDKRRRERIRTPLTPSERDLLMLNPFSRFLVVLIAAASITRRDKPARFHAAAFRQEEKKRNKNLPIVSRRTRFWHFFGLL